MELLILAILVVVIFQAITHLIVLVAGLAGIQANGNLIFSALMAAVLFFYGRA